MKTLFANLRALLFAVASCYGCYLLYFSSGCAARKPPASDRIPETKTFWHGCQETVPANADGFQHFICIDYKNQRYEVLIRREGK